MRAGGAGGAGGRSVRACVRAGQVCAATANNAPTVGPRAVTVCTIYFNRPFPLHTSTDDCVVWFAGGGGSGPSIQTTSCFVFFLFWLLLLLHVFCAHEYVMPGSRVCTYARQTGAVHM